MIEYFKAPKEGDHVRWREFCDEVDEVFTKKGLEKDLDYKVGDVRTSIDYGRKQPTEEQKENVRKVVANFSDFIRKFRLDSKSFF